MLDAMRRELERQVTQLLEEAERSMRVEEILPHLHPVMPEPNDVADVLQALARGGKVERDGSYYSRPTPVPLDTLFATESQRADAAAVVEAVRIESAEEGSARLSRVLDVAEQRGVPRERALDAIAVLRNAGEAFSVGRGRLKLAKP